jgi:mannitol-1-phosphate 5-dehydrogenase
VEVVPAAVDYINKNHSYDIYIIDRGYEKKVIDKVRALSPITDEAGAIDAIKEADIITTSVCVDNLSKIAGTMAKGLKARAAANLGRVNVMACENAFYATDMLKKALLESNAGITEAELEKSASFPNVAVDRIALSRTVDGVRVPEIEQSFELVIEKNKLTDPASEPIKGAEYAENLGMYLERKLYVFNCGHASAAYLGYLNGKKTIQEALSDKAIYDEVVGVMNESAELMLKKFPFKKEDLTAFINKVLKRITIPELKDEVERVGRSPIRKLSAKDRLVGPAKEAADMGLSTEHLVKAIAAGYLFDSKDDEQAVEIQSYIKENGIEAALLKYSEIGADSKLYAPVLKAYELLKK